MAGNLIWIARLAGEFKLLSNLVLKSSEILVTHQFYTSLLISRPLDTGGRLHEPQRNWWKVHLWPQVWGWELHPEAHRRRLPVHGQRWPQHQRFPVLHLHRSYFMVSRSVNEHVFWIHAVERLFLTSFHACFLKTHFYSLAFNSVWELCFSFVFTVLFF